MASYEDRAWRFSSSSTLALCGLFMVLASACAGQRGPKPVLGRELPQVGWVIMSGDVENPDRDFVCQSNPRTECTVEADRPEQRVMAHVHLYYHAASTETKYTGTIRIGFFNRPHDVMPNITVRPGDRVGNQSIADFGAGTPGTYAMSIAVVATSLPTGQQQNLQDEVDVVVRQEGPGGSRIR